MKETLLSLLGLVKLALLCLRTLRCDMVKGGGGDWGREECLFNQRTED